MRAARRDETCERIVVAAVEAFAELGFEAASTRDIAGRAGVSQGLLTYHFTSKDALWRAAADRIFTSLGQELGAALDAAGASPSDRAREAIRVYVRFAAAHPELFLFMVDEGRRDEDRMHWLVDTYLDPLYRGLGELLAATDPDRPQGDLGHLYYVIAGAGSLMFSVAPECRRLTGIDPGSSEVVEAHADYVARLLVP